MKSDTRNATSVKSNFIIVLIILSGALVRLLWLGSIPSGFFRDEAALGYNAYSIWKTGMDEFGVRFPLFFRSFEVFFLPLYVYLSAPIVGFFGLNEFTTRFLSSAAGVFALLIAFLITKRVSGSEKTAMFATLMLAESPWHIFYSRGAFEGNLALTFFAAGFLFLLYFFRSKKQKSLVFSLIFFILSMYSYQAERVVVPLFGLSVLLLSFKKILLWKKKIIFPAVMGIVLLIPILMFTSKAAGFHRAFGVSIFNRNPEGWIEERGQGTVINNVIYLRSRQVVALYLSYFSPRNLFFEGDYDKQRSVENFSVFYPWMLPLLFIGFWKMIAGLKSHKYKLLFVWILIAPIPASLTGDPFHTYRSLLLYFPLTVLVGIGLNEIYSRFKGKIFNFAAFVAIFLSFSYFLYNYAVLTPAARGRYWDFGYKEMIDFVTKTGPGRVVIHDPMTEAYIHYLFFAKVSPEVYQKAVYDLKKPQDYYYDDSSEIRPVKVNNFEFRNVGWPSERGDSKTTFVFDAKDLPESEFKLDPKVELLKEINYPDGTPAYRIVRII